MLLDLLLALLTMLLCLMSQALLLLAARHYFAGLWLPHQGPHILLGSFAKISTLMIVLTLGSLVQMLIWAGLYWALGSFDDFSTALYFSGVTYTSLGYGDVVLPVKDRLLGPLQAANGLMMFGIITAVLVSAIQPGNGKPRR